MENIEDKGKSKSTQSITKMCCGFVMSCCKIA
jgi:hypothetical protein